MPTLEALYTALNKADKAGNISDAQEIAALIRELYPQGKVETHSQEVIDAAYIAEEGMGNTDVLVNEQILANGADTQVDSQILPTAQHQLTNDGVIREPSAAENITQTTRPAQELLATLDEGQVVVQSPIGIIQYVDQVNRIVTDNEEVVAAAMAYSKGESELHPSEVYSKVKAQETFQGPGGFTNKITGFTGNIIQGGLGLGSYRDEALGAVNDGVNWLYQQANRSFPYTQGTFEDGDMSSDNNLLMSGDEISAKSASIDEDFDEAYPKSAIALNLSGGLLTGYMAGSTKKAQQLYKWINKLPKIWKGSALFGTGAGIGGTEGTIYGYGAGEDGQRVDEAITQGIMGAAIGGPANLMLMPLQYGWSRIANGLKDKSTEAIASLFAVTKDTAQIIKETIGETGSTLQDMLANLKRGGVNKDGAMLADADVATQVITDAVAAAGGESASTVNTALKHRVNTTYQNLDTAMNQNIADLPYMDKPFDDIKADPAEIAAANALKSRPARNKAYKKAYAHQIDYLTPKGEAVKNALDDIDEDILTEILSGINQTIKKSGDDITELTLNRTTDAAGKEIIKLGSMPTMKQLDYIKRALSDIAYKSPGVLEAGKILPALSQRAKDALSLRYKLSEALKDANPAYRKAVKLGQDKITRENALEMGYSMLSLEVSPAMVTRMLKDAGEAELAYARMGIRANLEAIIGRMRPTPSRMANSKELDEMWKTLSSRDNRSILKLVLGPKEFKKMVKELDKAEVAIKLRVSVAENSKTAIRGNVLKSIDDVTNEAASIRQTMAEGRGIEATRKIIQRINETEAISRKHKKLILKELANAMTGARGKAAMEQLKAVYNAVKTGQQTMEQIEYISNLMATGINLQLVTGSVTKVREMRENSDFGQDIPYIGKYM